MFEMMKTFGGGTITIVFEDELMEEQFKRQIKTEELFLRDLPDEFHKSSEELSFYIPNPTSIVDKLSAKLITKISSPTQERFGWYMMDLIYS